jgi:flagellar protein FliO/FliZ
VAAETSLKFALAFLLVLGLIALAAWTLRRFGPGGLGMSLGRSAHGRRLSVVESLPLDPRHRLVLVRRDDREHLLLLGTGETVVESGIHLLSRPSEPRS